MKKYHKQRVENDVVLSYEISHSTFVAYNKPSQLHLKPQNRDPRRDKIELLYMDEGEKEGKARKVMEGVASIALLPNGSISGHFIQLPHSICYGLHGTELECERECSRGEDYRLIRLTVTDYKSKRERDIVVECRGHDAAKICDAEHAHGWQKDVVGMVEEKHGKRKVSVSFECETLKAEKAAENHLHKFMPKLVGMDAIVNIGPMTITGLDFDAESEHECIEENDSTVNR